MSILSKSKTDSAALVPVSKDSSKKPMAGVAFASSPRANLLPPEITDNNRRRSVRSGLRVIVVLAVLVAAGGIGAAWYSQHTAQAGLSSANATTADLATQRESFADVVAAQSEIESGAAAVKVGGGTDIDWSPYLQKLQGTLPSGVTLTAVTIKSADTQSAFPQSTVPLEGARIATITFTAASTTLPSIPTWIDGLSSLPGFADASPNSVSKGDSGYTATVTMNVNEKAYSNRFDTKKEDSK